MEINSALLQTENKNIETNKIKNKIINPKIKLCGNLDVFYIFLYNRVK